MAVQPVATSPTWVAEQFVAKYYDVLEKLPKYVHRFYKDDSTFSVVDMAHDPTTTPDTADGNITAIQSKVESTIAGAMVSKAGLCIDAQFSMNRAVLLHVAGFLTLRGAERRFSQTFVLAPQEKGYYVLNDMVRIFPVEFKDTRPLENGYMSPPPLPGYLPSAPQVLPPHMATDQLLQLQPIQHLAPGMAGPAMSVGMAALPVVASAPLEPSPIEPPVEVAPASAQAPSPAAPAVPVPTPGPATAPPSPAVPAAAAVPLLASQPPAPPAPELPTPKPAPAATPASPANTPVPVATSPASSAATPSVPLSYAERLKLSTTGAGGPVAPPPAVAVRLAPVPAGTPTAAHIPAAPPSAESAAVVALDGEVEAGEGAGGEENQDVEEEPMPRPAPIPRRSGSAPEHGVYVKNLPPDATDDMVAEVFSKFGQLLPGGATVHPNQRFVKVAYVRFQDETAKQNALSANQQVELGGKKLTVLEMWPRQADMGPGGRGRGVGRGPGRGLGGFDAGRGRGRYDSGRGSMERRDSLDRRDERRGGPPAGMLGRGGRGGGRGAGPQHSMGPRKEAPIPQKA